MKKITYFLFVLGIFSQGLFAQSATLPEKPIGIVPDSFRTPYGSFAEFANAAKKQDIASELAKVNLNYVLTDDVEEQKKIRLDYEKQKMEMALLEGRGNKPAVVSSGYPVGSKVYHKRVMKIVKRKRKKKCNC